MSRTTLVANQNQIRNKIKNIYEISFTHIEQLYRTKHDYEPLDIFLPPSIFVYFDDDRFQALVHRFRITNGELQTLPIFVEFILKLFTSVRQYFFLLVQSQHE